MNWSIALACFLPFILDLLHSHQSTYPSKNRPHWTRSLRELVEEADARSSPTHPWNMIQLAWLCLEDCQEDAHYNSEEEEEEEEEEEKEERDSQSARLAVPPPPSNQEKEEEEGEEKEKARHRLVARPYDFGGAAYLGKWVGGWEKRKSPPRL